LVKCNTSPSPSFAFAFFIPRQNFQELLFYHLFLLKFNQAGAGAGAGAGEVGEISFAIWEPIVIISSFAI
jgi:hypothetical protein